MAPSDNHWALVLAAGDGRRLQGLTRTASGDVVPKQFCTLSGGLSFLEETVRRAETAVRGEQICAVVASAHRHHWSRHLESLPRENIIVQPRNRGTAIGILLPLLHIMARDRNARIVMLPSDHHVHNEARLAASLRLALAPDAGAVVLLGMEPREPDPELGYIVPEANGHARYAAAVDRFVEKPPREEAAQLIRHGALWNTFIIVADAQALLRLFEQRCPEIVRKMSALVQLQSSSPGSRDAISSLYEELPELDFSRDILQGQEKHLSVLAVPDCGWSDLGTPQRVADALRELQRCTVAPRRFSATRAAVNLAAQHELQRPACSA